MKLVRRQDGQTLVDILVTIALLGIVAGMAVPMGERMASGYRMTGDAQGIANMVSLAKMRAASRFSRARVRANLNAASYQLEIWDKTANAWVIDGGTISLSRGVRFGFLALATPPPNTQVAIGQSDGCTAGLAGAAIANTACIVFNSRGVPVDTAGAPLGGNAFYITDGTGVYATTVTATPLIKQWWSKPGAAAWIRR